MANPKKRHASVVTPVMSTVYIVGVFKISKPKMGSQLPKLRKLRLGLRSFFLEGHSFRNNSTYTATGSRVGIKRTSFINTGNTHTG